MSAETIMKFSVLIFTFVFAMSCDEDSFNINSFDLNRYAINLSETPSTSEPNSTPVSDDAHHMIQHFEDGKPKQLIVAGVLAEDVFARVSAMAKNIHVVQVDLAALYEDVHHRGFGFTEIRSLLKEILKRNQTENTVFFMRDEKSAPIDWKAIEDYRVVVEIEHKKPKKTFGTSDFITREEFESEKQNSDNLAEAIILNSEAIMQIKRNEEKK